MLGNNEIQKPSHGDGDVLKVHSIFDTIQGEGPYCGLPAVFVRLAGCNLACTFCDTEFNDFQEVKIIDILKQVQDLSASYQKLIVITGGEPFLQPISKLCKLLATHNFKVQIESNGLLYRAIPKEIEVVCSPKNNGNGYYQIREDLLKHVIAIKFIISASNSSYQNIAEIGQEISRNIKVYVQPMDEFNVTLNQANIARAMHIAKQYNLYLSLQTHKILNIQ